jgi:Ca-activated chloride channel family protein
MSVVQESKSLSLKLDHLKCVVKLSSPLDLTCKINRRYLQPERKAVIFLSADVQTTGSEESFTPSSLNVCLAIDCSGSMNGEKLESAKEAAIRIVDLLRPTDSISIVQFSGKAHVITSRQRPLNKNEIQQRIRNLQIGGGTAMYDGIKQAQTELVCGDMNIATALKSEPGVIGGIKKLFGQKSSPTPPAAPSTLPPKENVVSRLILLTDGRPTVGPTEEGDFVGLSKDLRSNGVSVTTLGIGEDYNEDLLTAIAASSGGEWHHIINAKLLPDMFAGELSRMQTVMLVKPELQVHIVSGSELSDIYRVGTMVTKLAEQDYNHSGNDYTIPLEDLRLGQLYRVVFKVHVPPKPAGPIRIAKVALVGPGMELTRDIVVEFTPDQSRWELEDPLPRASLQIFDATVLARQGVGDLTISKQAQEKTALLMNDPRTATVVKGDPLLAGMEKTVVGVTARTIIKGKDLSKEDEKELKAQTTKVKR